MQKIDKTSQKSFLVTGGASGIGAAVVGLMVARGHLVTVMDSDADGLARLLRDIGEQSNILAVTGSVTRPEDCEAAVVAAISAFGRLDGLSHNAGIQRYGTVASTTPEQWDAVIDVNLKGAYLVARAAIAPLADSRGSIVFMGSAQSLSAQAGAMAYVVSKHGLLGLTTAMAVDHAAQGIRVNLVAPGSVDTPMLRHTISMDDDPAALEQTLAAMHPLGRIAQPREIAELVLFLLSERASFITGEIIRADGGLLSVIGGAPSV
jgi:NAD(P)-dependent dehydrogenase (short-subunit alcohol dehydrogenase family)